MKRAILIWLMSLAAAAAEPAVLNTEQTARYYTLTLEFHFLVRPNQTVADFEPPLAADAPQQGGTQLL